MFIKFLLYCLVGYLALRLFWSFMGPVILKWMLRRLTRKMQDEVRRQQNVRNSHTQAFEQEIVIDGRMKAKVKTPAASPKRDLREIAEEVDFEEIR